MSVLSKLRKASQLSFQDWRLLVSAGFWLPTADISLRLRGLKATQRLLQTEAVLPPSPEAEVRIARVAYLLDAANRHHVRRFTCLPRSLVLQRMLGRLGVPSQLRIGVDMSRGTLQGHAWVECNGEPLGEPESIERVFASLCRSEAVRS